MAFVGRRLLHSIFVLWAVATILFLMFRLMPGNPLAAYISEALSAEQQNLIMQQFGLDRPLWEQYVIYFGNLVQGELGTSFHRREPVLSIVLSVLPNTMILTFCGLFIAYAFGILAGAYLAWHRGTWIEGVVVPIALATRAAPEFLARHDPSRCVRVLARLVPLGRRQQRRRDVRGRARPDLLARLPPAPDAAGADDRAVPAGTAASPHAFDDDRGDARGVRHDGAHQGPVGMADRHPPRGAELAPPGADRLRACDRTEHQRQRRRRDRLQLARPRPAPRSGGVDERLPARPGRVLPHRPRRDRHESRRRPPLRFPRPEGVAWSLTSKAPPSCAGPRSGSRQPGTSRAASSATRTRWPAFRSMSSSSSWRCSPMCLQPMIRPRSSFGRTAASPPTARLAKASSSARPISAAISIRSSSTAAAAH